MGKKVCVPVACYEDTLIIAETSSTEPNAQQLKTWARGVGNVHVGWRGGGEKTKETLELAQLVQLSPDELAKVRAEALKLEAHAYEISKDVYGKTPPAELPSGVVASLPAATATVPAAEAKGGVVSQDLLKIEVQVEDILDVVPGGDWAKVSKDLSDIDAIWAGYQKQAATDGAPQTLLDAFGETLSRLKTEATAKTAITTQQTANDLSAIVVDLYDVYHPAEPTDLGRLDVLERQVALDVDRKDFTAAASTLAKVNATWERVKPFMLAHNATEAAAQFEKSLAVQASALKAQDGAALKDEVLNALEIVDALEKAAA